MAHPFPFWSPGGSSPDVPSSPSATDEPSADPPSFHSNGAFPARFDWAAGPPRFFPVESTFARAVETLLPEESPFAAAARAVATPPPFLTKTFDMVEDPATNTIVSWGPADNSFVVWDHHAFSRDLLPRCLKHNCFSNFVRQLNAYGFRKVNPNRWEFANEGFQRGRKYLLKSIQRRKPVFQSPQQQVLLGAGGPYLEVGKYGGAQGEVESLRRDKNLLMSEVVRLRQKQRSTEQGISLISQHLHTTEQRQQQMMTFLAKAMKNPILMAHLVQQNEQMKGFQTIAKRRCLPSAGTNNEETGL